jgi:hypothetical protein
MVERIPYVLYQSRVSRTTLLLGLLSSPLLSSVDMNYPTLATTYIPYSLFFVSLLSIHLPHLITPIPRSHSKFSLGIYICFIPYMRIIFL